MINECSFNEVDTESRQKLINFAHSKWGFNNWTWSVTKQELDFIDLCNNGAYTCGVVSFVSVVVKSLDLQREDIGYATTTARTKGSCIYQARKCAVTNALKESLLNFGGSVATELMEILDPKKQDNAAGTHIVKTDLENDVNLNTMPFVTNDTHENLALYSSQTDQNMTTPKNPMNSVISYNCLDLNTKNNTNPANQLPPHKPGVPIVTQQITTMRPNTNEAHSVDEALRAERKRRQKQAQEEFRLKQQGKHVVMYLQKVENGMSKKKLKPRFHIKIAYQKHVT